MNDLLAGQVEMYFSGIVAAVPLVNQGSLRALAITSDQRSELMPDVPTMSEAGLPGYEIQNWIAIFAPAGTCVLSLGFEVTNASCPTPIS